MNETIELKSVELYSEEQENGKLSYFLNVTYLKTNDYGVYELNYPKVCLPFHDDSIPMPHHNYNDRNDIHLYVNFGFGDLVLNSGGKHNVDWSATIDKGLDYKTLLTSESPIKIDI